MAENPAPSLDPTTIEAIRALNTEQHDVLAELADVFERDTPRIIDAIDASIAAHARESLGLHVHKLKSSSASIGALQLARVAGEIEQLVNGEIHPGAADKVVLARAAFEDAAARLRRLSNGHGNGTSH